VLAAERSRSRSSSASPSCFSSAGIGSVSVTPSTRTSGRRARRDARLHAKSAHRDRVEQEMVRRDLSHIAAAMIALR
jgi:hypothetical protein